MQVCLNELAKTLDNESLQKLADRLNRPYDGRLPAMWELVFLRGLAAAGPLRHETAQSNGRRPDFELSLSSGTHSLTVIGDICTVSDSGLDDKNPVELLSTEITRLAKKFGLNPNHFRYDVHGSRAGAYKTGRMALALPAKPQLQAIIKQRVEPFIGNLVQEPRASAAFEYNDGETVFTVGYDQAQRYAGGGHLSYDVAVSLTNNPIFKALKAKAAQLRGAPEDAIRLIILCDGDCGTMRSKHTSSMSFSARAIAEDFLRQNRSVDLVLLVSVTSSGYDWSSRGELLMHYELVAARSGPRPARLSNAAFETVRAALECAVATLPQPVLEPINAARRCLENGYGLGLSGAYMTDRTFKISSRVLHELLAGRITSDRFMELHGWDDSSAGRGIGANTFKRMLESGRLFKTIRVEPGGDKDDDWLAFEFGTPDPAVSLFLVPTSDSPKGD
jgi:hypothetical protein